MHPRFSGENLERNKVIYGRLADLTAKHACTPPQLALAWLLHQGEDIVPIPGIIWLYQFRFENGDSAGNAMVVMILLDVLQGQLN